MCARPVKNPCSSHFAIGEKYTALCCPSHGIDTKKKKIDLAVAAKDNEREEKDTRWEPDATTG